MSGLRGSVSYSLTFKLMVIKEVLSGKMSQIDASRKYGIKGHSTILKWIRKLEEDKPKLNLMESSDQSNLEARIKELEVALENEQLRSKAYEEMIKIAEIELKIKIRKKSSTKQSKK